MPFVSEIAPLLIVIKLEEFDYAGATAIAAVMLAISFVAAARRSTCCRPAAGGGSAMPDARRSRAVADAIAPLCAWPLIARRARLPRRCSWCCRCSPCSPRRCAKGSAPIFAAFAEPDALAAIRLTLLVAAIAVPLNLVFGVCAAWAIAKFEFPRQERC